jgi:hypothetical protein
MLMDGARVSIKSLPRIHIQLGTFMTCFVEKAKTPNSPHVSEFRVDGLNT